MESIFRRSWDELDAADIDAFLVDAGDEGLTWEAKGGEQPPHPGSIHKAVCGLGNSVGGYLIIGAERDEGGQWTLPGVVFPADEPGTWLATVIDSGFNLPPDTDVRVWERGDGRHASVVQVEPMAVPPCITTTGAVYQRVSGATLPVTDQGVLAQLNTRGDIARSRAEGAAIRAAERSIEHVAFYSRQRFDLEHAIFALAIAPTAGPSDKAARLFRQSFLNTLLEKIGSLPVLPGFRPGITTGISQDAAWAAQTHGWMGIAFWDGAVVVTFMSLDPDDAAQHEIEPRFRRAWSTVIGLAKTLGGYGSAHVVLVLNAAHERINPVGPERSDYVHIRQWGALRPPTEDELDAMARELGRVFGRATLEPEPEDGLPGQ